MKIKGFLQYIKEDYFKGGLADTMTIDQIAQKHGVSPADIQYQLEKGIQVELEHTASKDQAREIAMDHLVEFPDYYDRLEKAEESKLNESAIPDRYKKMGFTKVGVKKQAPDGDKHKWEVLARKKVGGEWKYKVVKGGARGMEDYTQHKDPKRRKAFWDRMGGKNSAKAKDPFSPLYWHKRFGTW